MFSKLQSNIILIHIFLKNWINFALIKSDVLWLLKRRYDYERRSHGKESRNKSRKKSKLI